MYVFDTNTFSELFKSFYRSRFPTLWELFDRMIEENQITSTREVRREIAIGPSPLLIDWSTENTDVFATPNAEEAGVVRNIYEVDHFQHNIEQKKLLKGGLNADPFVIARASVVGGNVVTLEKHVHNGAKIPNICEHLGVSCMNLEQFMEAEDWRF